MNNQDHPFLEYLPALLTGAVLVIVGVFVLVLIAAFLWFTAAIVWSVFA